MYIYIRTYIRVSKVQYAVEGQSYLQIAQLHVAHLIIIGLCLEEERSC